MFEIKFLKLLPKEDGICNKMKKREPVEEPANRKRDRKTFRKKPLRTDRAGGSAAAAVKAGVMVAVGGRGVVAAARVVEEIALDGSWRIFRHRTSYTIFAIFAIFAIWLYPQN
jgi:hypothetical protein